MKNRKIEGLYWMLKYTECQLSWLSDGSDTGVPTFGSPYTENKLLVENFGPLPTPDHLAMDQMPFTLIVYQAVCRMTHKEGNKDSQAKVLL